MCLVKQKTKLVLDKVPILACALKTTHRSLIKSFSSSCLIISLPQRGGVFDLSASHCGVGCSHEHEEQPK